MNMEYLDEEEIEYCKKENTTGLMKWVAQRLILENADEKTYNEIMSEAFPDMKEEYTKIFEKEVIPKLTLATSITEYDFKHFIESTPLATLKIETYGDYTLNLGHTATIKNDITYNKEYSLIIANGNFFSSVATEFEDKNGEEQKMVETKLTIAIHLRLKYAYKDGQNTYIAYRLGKDMYDRVNEVNSAIEDMHSTYHLSPKDCYNIKLYLDDIIPQFLKYDRPIDTRISIKDGIISINYPATFNEKEVLESLSNMYDVTTQKELMNFLLLYSPIMPFNVELRKQEMPMALPIATGKGRMGKSAMVKQIIVKGFDNPDAEKSEDDVFTKASLRENLSKSIFPTMIDEITQPTMERIYGSIKNLATGKGSHSRGRPNGGLNTWLLSSIPVFTSNEAIYIDSGLEGRFFRIIASEQDNNIQEWRKAKEKLPAGYLYVILKEIDGMKLSEMVNEIMRYVNKDEDYIYSYQLFTQHILDKLYKKYNMENPFKAVRKEQNEEEDWYSVFAQFIFESIGEDSQYLKDGYDYEILDGYVYITQLGFQKFLKVFPKCPAKTMSTFALNSPNKIYEIKHVKKRICHAKNPISAIRLIEKEEIQTHINTEYTKNTPAIYKQLDMKQ